MSRLPILKAKEIIKILNRLGFQLIRKKGSHYFFRHPDGRTTIVPVHLGQDIRRGLLRGIIKDIEISPSNFLKVIKQ